VGDYALKLGKIAGAGTYAVDTGPAPIIKTYKEVREIAPLLRSAIQELTGKGKVSPENIVVLSPYKYSSEHLMIKDLVEKEGLFTTTVKGNNQGKVRIGAIQWNSFKTAPCRYSAACTAEGSFHMSRVCCGSRSAWQSFISSLTCYFGNILTYVAFLLQAFPGLQLRTYYPFPVNSHS